MTLTVSLTTAALLGLLLVLLAGQVSRLRIQLKISLGDGGNKDLSRFIRLHANTVEQAPIFLLMALIYELAAGSSAQLMAVCALFVVSRLLYAWGMWGRGFSRQRQLGALGSYIAQVWIAVALLVAAAGATA